MVFATNVTYRDPPRCYNERRCLEGVRSLSQLAAQIVQPVFDWSHHPFVVIWEVTRACALACRHCRASAIPHRHPLELTTDEGIALIDDVYASGTRLFVLTGGDPALRPDLTELVRHASKIGLKVGLSPSATPRMTKRFVGDLADAGASTVSLSIDGSTAATHDAFRGVEKTFARTLKIADWVRDAGIALQVNTTVSRFNLDDLPEIARLVEGLGVVRWSVFFLVPTGRAKWSDLLSAEEHERVYRWLWELEAKVDFDIKTTEGQPYRRFAIQEFERQGVPVPRRLLTGVSDGRGFCFVSHTGDVSPSGFLELPAGNVRQRPASEIYRESPVFSALRDPDALKGKCRHCRYRAVCGGSRARAYHMTGDILASDPTCAYIPSESAR